MEDNNSNNNSNQMPLEDLGDFDFSNQELLSSTNIGDVPNSGSMDSLLEELLKDNHACTHVHTCNPPGPDLPHTHTCFHVHTKIVGSSSKEKSDYNDESAESEAQKTRKRGREQGGNREAVRKYRQKKKAYATSLQDEVVKLRALNQHLLKRLEGQTSLESEVARLKCLLVDVRGRIDGEIGSFPYQRPVEVGDMNQNVANTRFSGSYMIQCNALCGDKVYCLHDGKTGEGAASKGQDFSCCEYENLNNMASPVSAPSFSCGMANLTTTIGLSGIARRKRVVINC